MDPSAVPALPARQPTPDLTAVLKHIEMSPDQLLSMVIAKHSTALLGAAFTLPQPGGLPNLQNDRRSLVVKPALDHFPVQSQSHQFLKHSFRCHAPTLQLFHRKQRRTRTALARTAGRRVSTTGGHRVHRPGRYGRGL